MKILGTKIDQQNFCEETIKQKPLQMGIGGGLIAISYQMAIKTLPVKIRVKASITTNMLNPTQKKWASNNGHVLSF